MSPKLAVSPPNSVKSPVESEKSIHPLVALNQPSDRSWWRWILGLGLLVAALLAGLIAMINYLPTKAKAIQLVRSQSLSAEISEQDQQILLQGLRDTQAMRETLNVAFPTEGKLLEFIRIIDRIRDTQVHVERFTVDSDIPTKIGRNPSFLPMTLILSGTQTQINQAIAQVIDSPYFIHPVSFTQEFDPSTDEVVLQWQFQLFVAENFVQTNP